MSRWFEPAPVGAINQVSHGIDIRCVNKETPSTAQQNVGLVKQFAGLMNMLYDVVYGHKVKRSLLIEPVCN